MATGAVLCLPAEDLPAGIAGRGPGGVCTEIFKLELLI